MSKTTPPPTPERNRLRAAAALIPIIESGLDDGKLAKDKARQMIGFCEWSMTSEATDSDVTDLKAVVRDGLIRLQRRLSTEALTCDN